jgi:hypothetical protein
MVALASRLNTAGMVKVVHGASDGVFPVAGHPVGVVRRSVADALNVPHTAVSFVDGVPVGDGHRLAPGSTLEFVFRWGRKGAGEGQPARITEDRLHELGYTVEGGQAVPVGDEKPDESWGLDRLAGFARAKLAASGRAEQEAVLQAHKSAVALFWAGCALSIARDKSKAEGHGRWAEWKREKKLKDTTVNDAIRLFENAKTEDALTGLGITEAKYKFVYPPEGEHDGSRPSATDRKGKRKPKATDDRPPDEGRPPLRVRFVAAEPGVVDSPAPAPGPDEEPAHDEPAGAPALTPADELTNIAQRLTEIALNEIGKVEDVTTLFDTYQALCTAVGRIGTAINRRLPDA